MANRIIKTCTQCSKLRALQIYSGLKFICLDDGRPGEKIPSPTNIPDWCPLEKAPEPKEAK
jgi:hypothetical protein